MQCNVGPNERYVRVALGLAMATAAASMKGSLRWRLPLGMAAVAELATAATRYCPVSALVGVNNCRSEETRLRDERTPGGIRVR